jgi:hypothetical protein
MLGRSKPVVFDPYGSRRSRRRVPRWLVLMLLGIGIGAGGVIYVQERHLPPRLSAEASTQLRSAFEQADAERQRLKRELDDTAQKLQSAVAERQAMADELATTRQTAERLRGDVGALVALLPPDPRGGTVQVRAARFAMEGRNLVYDVVLSRDRAGGKALSGVMQLVVAGATAKGPETALPMKPVAISVGSHESVRGGVALPEGFNPRQTTVKVMDRPDGKLLGMRVLLVN